MCIDRLHAALPLRQLTYGAGKVRSSKAELGFTSYGVRCVVVLSSILSFCLFLSFFLSLFYFYFYLHTTVSIMGIPKFFRWMR